MGLKERQEVLNKPKLILYKLLKENFQTEKYCEMNLTRSQRSLLGKLRLGALPIRVETGRYNLLERNQRLCMVCNKGNIEDEYRATHNIKVLTSNINLIRKTAYYLKEMLNKRQYVLFN